jgi:hypothetical protein
MPSQPEELRDRTKQFAIKIVKHYRARPNRKITKSLIH